MTRKKIIDKVLDVKGLLCPVPTVMTSQALKDLKKGNSLQVITNDVSTKDSIPAICTENGYNLVDVDEKDGLLYFIIQK